MGSYVIDLGGGDDTLHLGAQKSMIDGGSGTDLLSVNASIGVNTLYVDLDKEFYFTEEIGLSFDGQDISLKDFESVTVIGSVTSTILEIAPQISSRVGHQMIRLLEMVAMTPCLVARGTTF